MARDLRKKINNPEIPRQVDWKNKTFSQQSRDVVIKPKLQDKTNQGFVKM